MSDQEFKWISVKDRLPEWGDFILVFGSHSIAWLAQYREDDKFHDIEDGDWLTGITHWMQLPLPPND